MALCPFWYSTTARAWEERWRLLRIWARDSACLDDSFNRGQLNNMCKTVLEAVVFLSQYWSQTDSSGRKERKKEVLEKDLPPKLASINQKIKESNSTSGFCCDHLTYPDFFVFFLFHEVLPRAYPKEVQETERKKYPEVTKLCEAVGRQPNMKKYLESFCVVAV